MSQDLPQSNIVLRSLVKPEGELDLTLVREPMPQPKEHEVLIKVLAAPINPSDLFLLFAGAEVSALKSSQRDGLPSLSAPIADAVMNELKGRVGMALPAGNEGSGLVVQAGSAPEAQALLGKAVTVLGMGMYAEHICLPAKICTELPAGTDPRDAASCFVNPLTALGFVETAKLEGHKAIVHTAAASNLGQMLNRICLADGVPLINIVRRQEQAELLKEQGAEFVLNATDENFKQQLKDAIEQTGATIAFDAIGGGKMGAAILQAMEGVMRARMTEYNRYGSDEFKQLYVYGALDFSATTFNRTPLGFKWSISGWLLTHFLERVGGDVAARMRKRVIDELHTTFASGYSHQISLREVLDPNVIAAYDAKHTGEKYLVIP